MILLDTIEMFSVYIPGAAAGPPGPPGPPGVPVMEKNMSTSAFQDKIMHRGQTQYSSDFQFYRMVLDIKN